ncbi:kinase-like domain-containing protein [Rhizophagus clarus]|uniref:Kinase-like domain-containing protein n=1 Tax=Rhizophagus clarus TaxID=94130 RepID=A0A8H3QXP9_9GLOM|nr:kinase-like domain-containing protein [Rhizophagus clarus]
MELLTKYYVNLSDGKEIIKENFTNWKSGNEIIDNFIQEKQLKYAANDFLFEWIPYNEFINIKEIGDNCLTTAIWKNGPLHYHNEDSISGWTRKSYEKVVLRFLYDIQNINNESINKIESYINDCEKLSCTFHYGISQNPDTKDYILVFNDSYFTCYCEKCGYDIECCKQSIWKDGPLYYDKHANEYTRNLIYEKVVLRFLYDSQDINDEFLNMVESYLYDNKDYKNYGISQNPDTKVYILVFNYDYFVCYCGKCGHKFKYSDKLCDQCQIDQLRNNFTNWTSENEKLDNFIQNTQLKINRNDVPFEWIPYNEFIDIKQMGDDCLTTAIWKDGPLHYDKYEKKYLRNSTYEKVVLRSLYGSQKINDEFLNMVESYLYDNKINKNYGITQNSDTKVYILVFNNKYLDCYCEKCGNTYEKDISGNDIKWCKLCQMDQLKTNFTNWTSGNVKLDKFIQNIQLKINKHSDVIFEWISYNEFTEIKGIDIENEFAMAIWKDGPLIFTGKRIMTKESYKKVVLKYLHNLQDITDEFLNKVESYFNNKRVYGISQNPDTKVYILYSDTVFEWISYNRFTSINETENSGFATAMWKDGPLFYNTLDRKYKRKLNEKVFLKYLYNPQNIINEIMYLMEGSYGLSQNPNTKDFIILVFPLKYYCENCGEKYNNRFEIDSRSCLSCQIKREDEKIRDLIQDARLNIDYNSESIIFEWIPYNQFSDIKEIGKGGFSTVYSAIWKDGLLYYERHEYGGEWKRKSNTRVALKCLHNSHNSLTEFINEVKAYPNQKLENILKLYGISQNPDTKDYVMILEYAEAPEVLGGKLYTRAADIYSFGMIMYVVATGRQPFADRAHDEVLALNIYNGIRPEINEKIAPKCYIDIMKRCWDPNPDNRPTSIELKDIVESFHNSLNQNFQKKEQKYYEIEEQFKKTQEYRKANFLSIKNGQTITHTQAIYSSRLLNPFTKNLSKYYNIDNNTVEITDFTK